MIQTTSMRCGRPTSRTSMARYSVFPNLLCLPIPIIKNRTSDVRWCAVFDSHQLLTAICSPECLCSKSSDPARELYTKFLSMLRESYKPEKIQGPYALPCSPMPHFSAFTIWKMGNSVQWWTSVSRMMYVFCHDNVIVIELWANIALCR